MRFQQQIHIPAVRETVWELLADTERLNREMGLPPIHFEFRPREGGGSDVLATLRLGRLEVRYREHPFEWVRPEQYSVRRSFFGGPIREIRGEVRLEEAGERTRVTCIADVRPHGAAGWPIAYAVGRKAVADFMTACRGFSVYLGGKADTPYPRHAGRPAAAHSRLESARARLTAADEADPRASQRLAEFLERAPAEDVVRIRPFALADRWGLDRLAVLRTCLLAARVGMLDLRWRVLCPSCRGSHDDAGTLRDVGREVHCAACNLRFDAEFDRSVEVCFAAPPAIRAVQEQTYCIGGPALTPHILAQWILAPGEERETRLTLPPGSHVLTGPQLAAALPLPREDTLQVVLEPQGGRMGVQ